MKNEKIFLVLIFLAVFISQIFFIARTGYLSGDKAYFNQRYVEYIIEHKKPMTFDDLSFGGKEVIEAPFFYYVLAFFGLFLPLTLVLKIIPLIFMSSIVLIAYLITKEITENVKARLFATFLTGFVPIYFVSTLNQVSVYSLLIPLMFLMVYCVMKMEKNNIYLNLFVILSFILPLVHPYAIIFVVSMVFYLLMISSEGLSLNKLEKEALLFSTFLLFLIGFIIFKKAFLVYGFELIWQNVPTKILQNYFMNISVFEIIYKIGIIPVFLGGMGILYGVYKKKNEPVFLLASVVLASLLLSWLKLIEPIVGLMFLGIALAISCSVTLDRYFTYIPKTKFSGFARFYPYMFSVFIILLMVVPSFIDGNKVIKDVPSDDEIQSFIWLKENTEENAVVLGTLEEGNLITQFSKRKDVIDTNFLLAPNVNKRFDDVNLVYNSISEPKVQDLFFQYNVGYVYFSSRAKEKYKIDKLGYEGGICLEKIQERGDVEIFRVKC